MAPRSTHQLSRFGSSNRELEVGVFFPVSEKEGELGEKAVVDVSGGGDSGWIGVAIQTPFQGLCSSNELFPCLEVVRVLGLAMQSASASSNACWRVAYHFGIQLFKLSVFLIRPTKAEVGHRCRKAPLRNSRNWCSTANLTAQMMESRILTEIPQLCRKAGLRLGWS